jgi:hypothetical protein
LSRKFQYRVLSLAGGRDRFISSCVSLILAAFILGGCSAVGSVLDPVPPTLASTLSIVFASTDTLPATAAEQPDTPVPPVTEMVTSSVTATITRTSRPSRTPTFGPSPTPTRTPTATRLPTLTRIPSRTPTITFTPTPPAPSLNIVWPGLFSKVVSPITTEMQIISGADSTVTMDLIGEDGRVISRRVMDYGGPNMRFWTAPELPFEIGTAAETARLQISTRDEFGRVDRLFSVDLLLLQVGRNEINPPAITEEPYLIRRPRRDAEVTGGTLVVEALVRPVNASPLIIELIDEENTVVSIKQVIVDPPTGALSHTPIRVEIPYRVSSPQGMRLVLRQEGSRIPGTVALSSQRIILTP